MPGTPVDHPFHLRAPSRPGKTTPMASVRFDRRYYQRYYFDLKTRVHGPKELGRLGTFVCAYLKYLQQPVRTVLDVGCGIGLWRPVVQRHFPRAEYTGVEVSPYLCRKYGWQRGSVVDYRAGEPSDLVICQSVLQYLDAPAARRAIQNLARHCAGALYLEVPTPRDWIETCDQERTDDRMFLRSAAWYRRELRKYFTSCGGGLFLARDSPVILYTLERNAL